MSPRPARADLHRQLDALLDRFEAIENSDELTRQVAGMIALSDAAAFAGSLPGKETLFAVYGASSAASRANLLVLLSRRLAVAANLFREIWTGDGHAVADAAEESLAISRGDNPRLFRQLGKKKVPARAATERLRALEWDRYLEAAGVPSAERQRAVADAYGASSWETVRKWPDLIETELGAERVRLALAEAALAGAAAKTGESYVSVSWQPVDDWRAAVKKDGLRLRHELAEKASKSPG